MAPLVALLLQNGLGLLGNAVLAKGKEWVEEKTGLDIEAAIKTPDGLASLRQAEMAHEEALLKLRVEDNRISAELEKANLQDTQNARDMNAAIQQSGSAGWLAKNLPYLLDIVIVSGALVLGLLLFVFEIPKGNRELALTAFGLLLGLAGTVINFHRGSSKGSKDKDDLLAALAKKP